jgi:hypothetical protein
MANDFHIAIGDMRSTRERVGAIRGRYCEPKSVANDDPYDALSRVISSLGSAIKDMERQQ